MILCNVCHRKAQTEMSYAGKRKYAAFNDALIKAAKVDVASGVRVYELLLRNIKLIDKHWKIKCLLTTQLHMRPTELTGDEEKKFAERIKVLGDWGFPVIAQDIRMFVKGYLDKVGVQNFRWKNNIPGHKWANNFCKRNELSMRGWWPTSLRKELQ